MDKYAFGQLPFASIWEREQNKEKFLKRDWRNQLRARKRRFQTWRRLGRLRGLPKEASVIIEQIKSQMGDWLKSICGIDATEVLRQTKVMPVSKEGVRVINGRNKSTLNSRRLLDWVMYGGKF